jgi:hypothetical protein
MNWPKIFTSGRSILDDGAARARRLKADKDHQVPRIGQPLRQMMQDAAAGHHPARRNNDRRKMALVNLLRLLGGLREREALPLDRRAVFRIKSAACGVYSSECFRKISTARIAIGLSQYTGNRGIFPSPSILSG